jgi:cell division protein FtsB
VARARRSRDEDDEGTSIAWRRGATRLLGVVVALLLAYFVIEGGEYGTSDLWRLRGRIKGTQVALDSIKRVVDSLSLRKKDVQTNPAVQERIAREEFGMVKGDREVVYHLLRPDTAAVDSSGGGPR